MGKKLKAQKKTSPETAPKTINFSALIKQTNEKLSNQNFPDISLNTVKFDINPASSELEKKYNKLYISYLHDEFNFKIIKMYFNYISSSKAINPTVKDNRPFLIDFLKIITNLLMNEIDLSTMAYLLEQKVKWIKENETDLMWNHLYNVCLKAKQITSSSETFDLLINILDNKNPGFKSYYNKWLVLKKCPDKIDINLINEEYNTLMKSNYLNQNNCRFINYNEIVNKILEFSEKPVKEDKNSKKRNKRKLQNIINNEGFAPYGNNIINPGNNPDHLGNQPSLNFNPGAFPFDGGEGLNLGLGLPKQGSVDKFPPLNIPKNNQFSNPGFGQSSRNFDYYYSGNYFNLNLSKKDSSRSFMSSLNDPNN